jgi:hypothetical protein
MATNGIDSITLTQSVCILYPINYQSVSFFDPPSGEKKRIRIRGDPAAKWSVVSTKAIREMSQLSDQIVQSLPQL